MKTLITNNTNLEIVKFPFRLDFAWKRKKNLENDHWFTNNGTCKLWIGSLAMMRLGDIPKKDFDHFVKEMKKYKTNVLTDGRNYYTTTNGNNTEYGISEITNFGSILYKIINEWNARHHIEDWTIINEDTNESE